MSKVDLASREWCELVFEGRNKEYGAYRHRANKGKFQLRAIIIVLILIVAIVALILIKSAVVAALEKNKGMDNEQVTELSQLKKDEPKKEEKKKEPELKYEEPKEIVKVKSSIQFTVPKIVEDDKVDRTKELKTQEEVTKNKFAISSQDFDNGGDPNQGINIDDMKESQEAGNTNTAQKKEPEVVDNALVEVQASYPGGEAALLEFISKNLVYPAIAQEQEVQGTVVLRFKVAADGSVSDVRVVKSLTKECDQAAAAVVRKLRRFVPAKQQGHPVPVWFQLPIRFRIQ